MTDSDEIIVRKIIAGDINQYRWLVEKYQNPVFRVILKIVGDDDEAQELTQDVFVKAFESLHQYKVDYKFFSWIYRMAINRALLFEKKKKEFTRLEVVKNQISENTEPDLDEERSRQLSRLINKLSEHYRTVILLKYYSNLSYTEIAETLDVPEKTVKSRLFDARKILRDWIVKLDIFIDEPVEYTFQD